MRRSIEGLKQEGFGVITEIDVKETFKKKINVDFRNYRILGACNPMLAHEALKLEDKVGTMLPCNVVVQDVGGGRDRGGRNRSRCVMHRAQGQGPALPNQVSKRRFIRSDRVDSPTMSPVKCTGVYWSVASGLSFRRTTAFGRDGAISGGSETLQLSAVIHCNSTEMAPKADRFRRANGGA